MLDKILDIVGILVDRIPMNNQWYARFVCLPSTLWFLFFVPIEVINSYINYIPVMLMATIFVLVIWYFCRKQKWLWILPYLCIGKILLATLIV